MPKRRALKVLQLASYDGNIGDNANISGTRRTLRKNFIDVKIEYTNVEIRDFFRQKRKFDSAFIDFVNEHDLFIFGGGNYFELWVSSSATGTSVDLNIELLKKLKIPVVFYGLGCDAGMGIAKGTITKFTSFLDYVLDNDRFLVSVRNDGSLRTIEKYFGRNYAEHIYRIPDGGFFVETDKNVKQELYKKKRLLGINLAGDMIDIRFKKITLSSFVETFSSYIETVLNTHDDIDILLFPHIYKDYDMYREILFALPDWITRSKVSVAPYLHGMGKERYVFALYKLCDVVLGNRFHANVCPIGLGVPTIGLVNYPQVEYLYHELGQEKRITNIDSHSYVHKLVKLTFESIKEKKMLVEEYRQINKGFMKIIGEFHQRMKLLLN